VSQPRVSITPADAWSDQRLTPLQCRLLGLIGSYLSKEHTAWPSQSTLARHLGVSRKAVNEGIKALALYGYVQIKHRHREDGGQTSSVYFVVMDPKERAANTDEAPCNSVVTPLSLWGATPCNPMDVTPPVTSEGDTKKDPEERPNELVVFEEAWKVYQSCKLKASAQKKKPALAAWKVAARKLAPELLLAKVRQAADLRNKAEGFYPALPHMHRWLQREEWSDLEESTQPATLTREEWALVMDQYKPCQEWPIPDISPPPTDKHCKAPADMLEAWRKDHPQENAPARC
jgi:hypothetical protein